MEPIKLDCVYEERISKENNLPYRAIFVNYHSDKGDFKKVVFLKFKESGYLEYLASNTTNGKPQSLEEPSVSPYDFES